MNVARRTAGKQGGTQMILTGDRQLDKKLRRLEFDVQKKLVKKATKEAVTEIVLPDVQSEVPRDFGTLADMLKVRATRGRRGKNQFGHAVTTKRDGFYGTFVEFGTEDRFHASGRWVGAVSPKNWMRPALYNNADRLLTHFKASLRKFLKEFSGK